MSTYRVEFLVTPAQGQTKDDILAEAVRVNDTVKRASAATVGVGALVSVLIAFEADDDTAAFAACREMHREFTGPADRSALTTGRGPSARKIL